MGRRRHQQPNVQRTHSKRPEWYFRARADAIRTSEDGERVIERPEQRYYLGFVDEMTKQEAKKRRDEILGEVINKPQILIPSQVKFSEVIAIYKRDWLANLRQTTQETQGSQLRTYIEPTFGKLRICDIDALAIQRWISSMAVAYQTKRGTFNLLKTIWNRAQDWGFTREIFPCRMVSLGVNRPVKGHEMPTMEQIRRLVAALQDPFRAMAEIALYAGLRISEVRGLQWGDITAETVVVRRRISETGNVDVTKSSKPRVFDARPLWGVLERQKRTCEWVFPRDGTSYSTCLDNLRAAQEIAGITTARFGWHHLRAVCNTLMRSRGADSLDRQALLGHQSAQMNEAYVLNAQDDIRRRGDLMLRVQAEIMGDTKGVQ